MTARKRDWDVITGWEKRIKVDYGSIGPNHVRWSDWTWKERDIVARKVHESAFISKEHGPRSKAMEEWAEEHAPIMVGFARDHKPMPPWAHADYRESGVPEHVKVVWKRESPNDPTSPGDWDYNPPGPWEEGEEPAWSAKPKDPDYTGHMHAKFGGVISYRTAANGDHIASDGTVISTAESRAKEDVPEWRKFELGRLEDVDGVIVPGPNALPKDEEKYGENVKLTKRGASKALKRIMPDDPNFSPMEKALSWARETHHGEDHQFRWNGVAAALGADNGHRAMALDEVRRLWKKFNHNKRWTMAVEALTDSQGDDIASANRYRKAVGLLPIEKSQSEKLHDALVKTNERPDVEVKKFDPDAQEFREIAPNAQYRLKPMAGYGMIPPEPGSTGWYTRKASWLPQWYWDLPEITDEEAQKQGASSRASVAPMHYIYHKHGVGILGRQKPSPERLELPIWTRDQADSYYRKKGIKMRSITWLDGHKMTRKGYTTTGDGFGEPIARAASEEYEEAHKSVPVPNAMAAAIEAGDWLKVANLAARRAG